MSKYGKNNYFDGVILPEPKEEMLRRMAKGVKLGYNQVSTASGAIKMVSPGIPIETNDVSIEFFGNSFGSNNYDRPFIFNNGRATLFQAYAKKNRTKWRFECFLQLICEQAKNRLFCLDSQRKISFCVDARRHNASCVY